MTTSTSWAQDVITCDLCDKATQQFCNSCQVNLCDACVKKHRNKFKSLTHEIVPFLERKIQFVFPECREHSGQRCEVSCKKCNEPVCIKCIGLGPHKGHDVEDLTETHEKKIRKIKSDTEEIKVNIIPKYQIEDRKIGNTISKTKSKMYDLGKESKRLRKLSHQEVDDIFDKIDLLSQSLGLKNLNALQQYQNKIRNIISEMNKTVKQNEKLSKSKNVLEVNKFQSNLNEYQDFLEPIIEIGGFIATLKQMSQPSLPTDFSRLTTELDKVSRLIATIGDTSKPLRGFTCVEERKAWIFGDNETFSRFFFFFLLFVIFLMFIYL